MDPQQRLLLEIVLGGARATPASTRARCAAARTGVFVGASDGLRTTRLHEAGADLEGHLLTGTAAWSPAGSPTRWAWRARR